MAEFSRVKKYEQLRKDIETDQTQTSINRGTINYRENAKEDENYTPTHEKVFSQNNDNKGVNDTSSFKNEYLDSFIQEVREYNIQKGIRESEDTKLDILQQLTTKNRERRTNYIEKMDDDVLESTSDISQDGINVESRNEETLEISRQVFDLLNEAELDSVNIDEEPRKEVNLVSENELVQQSDKVENENDTLSEMEMEVKNSLDDRIAQLEKEVHHTQSMQNMNANTNQEEISEITKKELLEQTMQLKVKIDQYENDLSEINSGVDNNNRLLNIVITVLIIALLAVIGIVVYWLISGGII